MAAEMSEIPASESDQHVIHLFRLSPKRWWNKRQLKAKAVWAIPGHLCEIKLNTLKFPMTFNTSIAHYWANLESLNSRDGTMHRLLEVRTESLLFVILAGEVPPDQWKPPGLWRAFQKTIHWNLRQQILPQNQPDNSGQVASNIVDYVLWYGHPAELETNLIIMNSNFSEPQGSPLFHNMARIHTARKQAGRNSAIYGIMTDGRIWMFLFISHSSRVYLSMILPRKTGSLLLTLSMIVHQEVL